MSEKDKNHLLNILDCGQAIRDYVVGLADADAFFSDRKTFDATLMNFVVIGEVIGKLSTETKNEHQQIPWNRIKDFRNVVAHDYFGVDAEEVWQVVHKHLPKFLSEVQNILHQK